MTYGTFPTMYKLKVNNEARVVLSDKSTGDRKFIAGTVRFSEHKQERNIVGQNVLSMFVLSIVLFKRPANDV